MISLRIKHVTSPVRLVLSLVVVMLLHKYTAQAQATELGVFAGFSNYMGDLSPAITPKRLGPAAGLTFAYTPGNYLTLAAVFNYGEISAADKDYTPNAPRNLSFESKIIELGVQTHLHFLKFGRNYQDFRSTPFILTGINIFKFDPTTVYNGTTYNLRQVSTEGQGLLANAPKKYSEWSVSIPIGIGWKWALGKRYNLAVHTGFRGTFTDYLDDVSGEYPDIDKLRQAGGISAALSDRSGEVSGGSFYAKAGDGRGNPDNNDWYVMTGATLTYVLKKSQCYSFGKFRFPLFY